MAGSQEANNFIARAQSGGAAPTMERLAAFAATQNAKQLETNTYLRDILATMKANPTVGAI
jgi:hypothetical protein